MHIENSMKNPLGLAGPPSYTLHWSMVIIVLLNGALGFFGYIRYGERCLGSLPLNLPSDNRWAYCVYIIYMYIITACFVTLLIALYIIIYYIVTVDFVFVQFIRSRKNRSYLGNPHDLRTPIDRYRRPSVAMD